MHSSVAQRVRLLKEMALFRGLPEDALEQIADSSQDYGLAANKYLFVQGDRAENFYIVYSGLLRSEHNEEGEISESMLESGDAFGASALLHGGTRQHTVSALKDSHLLYLPHEDFDRLVRKFPGISEKLAHLSAGRNLKLEGDFDWLGDGESVYYIARKHVAYLWLRLARAMVLAIFAFLAFYFSIGAASGTLVGVGFAMLLGAVAWGAWEMFDWRNDFYVLTNLRVVWLERVLLRSSSRTEAPLASIQSVNMHTSLLGRLMGFGDVIVRTYTGTVLMPSVADPENTKHLIEDYIARWRKESREAKHESIRQAVRESLGVADGNGAVSTANPIRREADSGFQLFPTRIVEGDVITYRKHWFALFSSLLLPALFIVALLFGLRAFYGGLPQGGTGWLLSFVFASIPLAVIVYRLLDWQNDRYLLTPDSIIDTEKKPLGSEVTKSAPLANVLSLENHKVGIVGLLLNFGVVRANVGDSTLDFENVHNPARVQQDIFLRMEALKLKQQQGQADEERRRMTEWLRVYEQERGRRQPPANEGLAVE
jgi:hypothetical protein